MDHEHKIDIRLSHQVDVGRAIDYLKGELGCDSWYVACHHDHLFVFRLTQGLKDRFAVKVECTAPVEKGIYHNSKAWALSLSPLHDESNLTEDKIQQIQAGLATLA